MLKQFKSTKQGTLGEYIIDNYKKTGYRIVTIATRFPGKVEPNWGRGVGSWTVDYQDTSATFWSLMKKYKPIAVMTTSRNDIHNDWVLEIGCKNLARLDWLLLGFNGGRRPFVGGDPDTDPAAKEGCPNHGHPPVEGGGEPPDSTRAKNAVVGITDDTKAIQALIKAKLNDGVEFDPADLNCRIELAVQGTFPDNYVSAFAGYHAVWYDLWKKSCKAGWHTHVDSGITTANASKAIKLQLDVLIKWLNDN